MKRIFYIILQNIQGCFFTITITIGIVILWLKGDIKFGKQ